MVGAIRIFVHALMHILEPDPEAGDCTSNGLHLYCLTRVHGTNRIIACSLIYNRNIACSGGTRLDSYDMISVASEPGTTIITLGWLYFVLSC
jgi:hypothetical protein